MNRQGAARTHNLIRSLYPHLLLTWSAAVPRGMDNAAIQALLIQCSFSALFFPTGFRRQSHPERATKATWYVRAAAATRRRIVLLGAASHRMHANLRKLLLQQHSVYTPAPRLSPDLADRAHSMLLSQSHGRCCAMCVFMAYLLPLRRTTRSTVVLTR